MFIVRLIGSVAERLKAPVLKTGDSKGSQSSNLCASAILLKGSSKDDPFFVGKNALASSGELIRLRRRCVSQLSVPMFSAPFITSSVRNECMQRRFPCRTRYLTGLNSSSFTRR